MSSSCSVLGAWASRLRCLCTVQRWTGTSGHSAAKRRLQPGRAVDDEELGASQATGDQIVEDAAPRGFALAAHVLTGKQQLLPVAAHAEDDQHRDAVAFGRAGRARPCRRG